MKIIKNILIGLGVVFSILIGIAVFLFGQSAEFKDRNEEFVKNFTREFSQEWTIGSVSDDATNDFLTQINTPNGREVLRRFRKFGSLVKIDDVEMGSYRSTTSNGATGVIKFKAEFENVKALVTVTVREKSSEAKIHGFHIDPLSKISRPREVNI